MTEPEPLFALASLSVQPPGRAELLHDVSLDVVAGEVIAILGPSGAGKTTLLRALFDREALVEEGFRVEARQLVQRAPIGLVPQHGAVFDHLDVAGNVSLAIRHGEHHDARGTGDEVRRWLSAVDLDPQWATTSRPVSHLSGGQAQRLAVARVLASGRRVLFLDEPSAGLDPARVLGLATQLRQLCDEEGAGVVLVTHDPQLAASVADRALVLAEGTLSRIEIPAREGAGLRTGDPLAHARDAIEDALFSAAASTGPERSERARPGGRLRRIVRDRIRAFEILVSAPAGLVTQASRHLGEAAHVFYYALRQSLLRPAPFYVAVSLLLGYTVLYVLTSVGSDFGTTTAIRFVRGMYVVALTPPIGAFLFVAASANSVNAWLGGMKLSRQIAALEALGISRRKYLWGPAWAALALSFFVVSAVFALGLLVGGWIVCHAAGMHGAWDLLTGDLLDPPPERAPYRTRMLWLLLIYAGGCASNAIARADEPKARADDVTRAMTRGVVSSTLWVMALELISLVIVRATHAGGPG